MIAILDVLFVTAFIGLEVAFLTTGLRAISMSDDRSLVLSSTITLLAGLISTLVVGLWAFFDLRNGSIATRRESWKRTILRYPALIGPAAYYLGEYRPKAKQQVKWFNVVIRNRRVLDRTVFVAWYGTLTAYGLVLAALVAALAQSSALFLSVGAVFVVLVVITGSAFCLLSLVVLIHATANELRNSKGRRHLEAVPRIGPLWVAGFRRYYEKHIRPGLIESERLGP